MVLRIGANSICLVHRVPTIDYMINALISSEEYYLHFRQKTGNEAMEHKQIVRGGSRFDDVQSCASKYVMNYCSERVPIIDKVDSNSDDAPSQSTYEDDADVKELIIDGFAIKCFASLDAALVSGSI